MQLTRLVFVEFVAFVLCGVLEWYETVGCRLGAVLGAGAYGQLPCERYEIDCFTDPWAVREWVEHLLDPNSILLKPSFGPECFDIISPNLWIPVDSIPEQWFLCVSHIGVRCKRENP